ncbi:MAG: SWIM zinc finger family protein, partial [Gammaproteobacteria bacterium]|nr:SWIM zinc finger family protein [Gammaproteobacteria bacterium]
MSFTSKDLLSFFKPQYVQRGRAYFEKGMVIDVEEHQAGRLISATVRGSGRNNYTAQIHLVYRGKVINDIQGNCDCPVGYNCKHVVAALLYFIDKKPPVQEDMFGLPSDKWLYQLKSAQHPTENRPVTNE